MLLYQKVSQSFYSTNGCHTYYDTNLYKPSQVSFFHRKKKKKDFKYSINLPSDISSLFLNIQGLSLSLLKTHRTNQRATLSKKCLILLDISYVNNVIYCNYLVSGLNLKIIYVQGDPNTGFTGVKHWVKIFFPGIDFNVSLFYLSFDQNLSITLNS